MKEAKLEASLVLAFQTVFGGHREIESAHATGQLGVGEVAPLLLEPVEHDDFDADHRLRREARCAAAAAEGEAVAPLPQMQIRTVKNAAGHLAAPNPNPAVRGAPSRCRAF